MRPPFLFYGRSAVQTGRNTKKKRKRNEKERLSLDRMVKNYGSRYGLMECSTEAHGA